MRPEPPVDPEPLEIIEEYLLAHTVSVCGTRCELCTRAWHYLESRGWPFELPLDWGSDEHAVG